jgi:hypothetical protein
MICAPFAERYDQPLEDIRDAHWPKYWLASSTSGARPSVCGLQSPTGRNRLMADDRGTDDDLAELIELATEATSAFIRGDMRRYFALIEHTDDYTLMEPTGGEVTHGSEVSEERIAQMARFFKTGDGTSRDVRLRGAGPFSSPSNTRAAWSVTIRNRTGRCG